MNMVPPTVRAAWELTGEMHLLHGGQGTSVRAGHLVLKPGADERLVAWHAQLCARLSLSDIRFPAPVPARDGRLVVDGWSATAYAAGQPVADDDPAATSWLAVLAASRIFHRALSGEPRPALLDHRDDRWAHADRVAWQEVDADDVGPRSRAVLARARTFVVDELLTDQLVHGDLSGNVLLADGMPPAVIDLSPYWRPAAYADAVVVVDALLWWSTEPQLVELGRPSGVTSRQWRSLLARALTFRLLAFDEPHRDVLDVDDQLPRYDALLDVLARDDGR